MTLTPGQSLAHYSILAPLGAGAMGEVWRARDTRLEREVAIKVLPEEFAGDEERLLRFEREAKALAPPPRILARRGRSTRMTAGPRLGASLLAPLVLSSACTSAPRIELRLGFEPGGAATPEWRAAVETHTGTKPAWEPRPLTAEEEAWLALARGRLPAWEARMPELCLPFVDLGDPGSVALVVGHQHGEDGFGLGEAVIYFDLSALARNYGSASEPVNPARLDRFFAHEFTHVLHWRWARTHPQPTAMPLERALWAMAREGLGNLRSLSETWVGPGGELTPLARETLAELEPILVERLAALAHATTAEEPALTAGLSWGPFRKKWGALPVALWLAEESRGDDMALRPFVSSGAAGVLALARRHLTPELAARLPRSPGG